MSNPLNWSGPEFLQLYVLLLALSTAAAFLLRWTSRRPSDEPTKEALDLTPYEVAYLAGGQRQAVDAALASLVHGTVVCLEDDRKLSARCNPPADAAALEKAVCRAAGEGASVAAVRASAAGAADTLRTRLEQLGLLLSPEQDALSRLLPLLVVAPVVLLGIAKAVKGWSGGKPIGFLLALLVLSAGILFFLGRSAVRSRRGDLALRRLEGRNSALKLTGARNSAALAPADMALAVALFGTAAIVNGPLARLHAAMQPPSSGGSGCSSCGSSSCGGGCGGGGCGGCS